MIEDFSSGYYRAVMDVQEYDHGPVIEQTFYDFINRKLHVGSDVPVMMRVGLDAGATFEVDAESAIPRDVLTLPPEIDVESGESSVFVLKADYVNKVGRYNG